MGVIIGIAGLFGLIMLVASQGGGGGGPRGTGGSSTGELPPPTWQEEPARVAACAMLANEIFAPPAMAQGICTAVWPGHAWPPTAKSPAANKAIWTQAVRYAEKVLAHPADYCGVSNG